MAGWQGMPLSVLVLLRKMLSAFGSPESSTHQVEPGRGLCPLHQTGNAKAAAGREELVSPIGPMGRRGRTWDTCFPCQAVPSPYLS